MLRAASNKGLMTANTLKKRITTHNIKRTISTKNGCLNNSMSAISNAGATDTTSVAPPSTIFQQPGYLRSSTYLKSKDIKISPNFNLFNGSQATSMAVMADKRDVMRLWSLLEACLQSNYKERSFSILKSLYDIESHRKIFIDDYNLYLNHICAESDNVKDMSATLQDDLTNTFIDVSYNDRTLAILIHHTLRISRMTESVGEVTKENVETFLSMNVNGVRNVCSYVDVLTVEDYKTLYADLDIIRKQYIPMTIRDAIVNECTASSLATQATGNSEVDINDLTQDGNNILAASENKTNMNNEEYTNEHNDNSTQLESSKPITLDEIVQTVEKNASTLVDVDTLGMKVIKHTLLGLALTDQQKEIIVKFSFDSEDNIFNLDDTKTIDFFEIYNSLKTDEEKKLFEDTLDQFNQNRQQALELRATDAAKERWRHDFEDAKLRGDLSIQKSLNVKLWNWYTDMLPLLKEEIENCKRELENNSNIREKGSADRVEYSPYLTLVNPEKMCVIAILEILKLNSTGGIIEGMRTARAVISVGKSIEMEFRSEQLLKNESYLLKDINTKSTEFKQYVRNAKKSLRSLKIDESKVVWPQAIRAKIGSILISMLINVAKIRVEGTDPITNEKVYGEAPAFSHSYQYHNGVKLGVIRIHHSLIQQLNGERLVASVQPQLLPMLVKPRPWVNYKSGGYYYTQSTLIRTKDSPEQMAYLEASSKTHAIDKVYDGLNVLGDTSWTVNKKIFDVVSKVWNKGGSFLEIPGIQDKLEYLPAPVSDADPSVINAWKQKNKQLANEYSSNRSMRCDMNYKLEIARAFLGEKFYFPHNLDFRGRAYPLSPHFNHLGNDMSRSLLLFWKGKKLGPEGFKWLKVHVANLFGVNKVPIEERVQFVNDHMDEIRDSVENPLDGKHLWWQKADKPWQTLATCIELIEALKLDNPEDFISHQPVHQDGTCNGLQHYAALGGDVVGASQVNLIPDEKPNDVYLHVAKIVKGNLQKKLETDPNDEMAKFFIEKLNRKIVKQTVMTHVYGVTLVGATLQIDKQINNFFEDSNTSLMHSKYLAKAVFSAIRQSFQGAHLIQDWLGECCDRISKSIRLDVDEKSFKNDNKPDFMTSVIWTTPLGLPIVQPYREASKKQVNTNLQTVYISDPFAVNQINARRQKAGFPPNFIHSLDASHMLLSASKCREDGLEFASVHDSYWTHASDITLMNKNLREQFVKLHEVDLIERLKDEFDERYKNYVQITKILKTSDIAHNVVTLKAKLAKEMGRPITLADEIQFEKQRQTLLNSASEEDVARGKDMVTTISLAENCTDMFDESDKKKSDSQKLLVLTRLKLPEIPAKGDFDVANVVNSTYFFS